MHDPLDPLLSTLRARVVDAGLDQLEPLVWTRIKELQRVQAESWRWRAGLAAAMLAVGVFAGGAAAAKSGGVSPFALHPAYAPSTLLEDVR